MTENLNQKVEEWRSRAVDKYETWANETAERDSFRAGMDAQAPVSEVKGQADAYQAIYEYIVAYSPQGILAVSPGPFDLMVGKIGEMAQIKRAELLRLLEGERKDGDEEK